MCLSVFANDTANADSTNCGTAAVKVTFVSILLTIAIATNNYYPVASTRVTFVPVFGQSFPRRFCLPRKSSIRIPLYTLIIRMLTRLATMGQQNDVVGGGRPSVSGYVVFNSCRQPAVAAA